MDKNELLEILEDERIEAVEMLEDLADETLLSTGVCGDWSIKDILVHLTHWEGQLITLLFQARRGVDRPSTIHFGKEKKDVVNQRWYEAGKDRDLERAWQDWIGVRKQTIRRTGEFSEDDLNDPNHYSWLNGKPLWQWIARETYEHEEEHMDTIREWLDSKGL